MPQIIKFILEITGKASENEALDHLKNNKKAIIEVYLKLLEIEKARIRNENLKNAREKDITKEKKKINLLIFASFLGLFFAFFMIFFVQNKISLTLGSVLIGLFSSCIKDIYVFYFGGNIFYKNNEEL